MERINILLRRKKLKLDHSWAIVISICSERRHSIRAARKSYDLSGDKSALEYGVEGSEEAARGRRQTVAISSSDTGGDKRSNWTAAIKCRT